MSSEEMKVPTAKNMPTVGLEIHVKDVTRRFYFQLKMIIFMCFSSDESTYVHLRN